MVAKKLARLGEVGSENPVAIIDDITYDVSSITSNLDGTFFGRVGIAAVAAAHTAGTLPRIDQGEIGLGAPIARPGAVICIGMNYAAHAAESGFAPPPAPIMFLKTPNTVEGPFDFVPIQGHRPAPLFPAAFLTSEQATWSNLWTASETGEVRAFLGARRRCEGADEKLCRHQRCLCS